jgi:hypothetical protein
LLRLAGDPTATTRTPDPVEEQSPPTVTISSSPVIRARAVTARRPQADLDPAAPPAEAVEAADTARETDPFAGLDDRPSGPTASIAAVIADQSVFDLDDEIHLNGDDRQPEERQPEERRRRFFRRRR